MNKYSDISIHRISAWMIVLHEPDGPSCVLCSVQCQAAAVHQESGFALMP